MSLVFLFILQDLKNNKRHQEELLREQATLKEDILESLKKCNNCQERQKRRENHLQKLQKEIKERETELAKQEAVMSLIMCLTFAWPLKIMEIEKLSVQETRSLISRGIAMNTKLQRSVMS